jgi:hypothetical protein
VRLQRVPILLEHRLGELRDQPLVRHVDVLDLDLGRLLVQEVLPLLLGVVHDRLGRIDEARLGETAHHPAVDAVAGDLDRPFGEGLRAVDDLVEVDVAGLAEPLAPRAHATGDLERAALLDLLAALLESDGTRSRDRGDVERERLR